MPIVLLSSDLMLLSRTQSAANVLQMSVKCAYNVEQALELATSSACRAIVVDLRTPNIDIDVFAAKVRDQCTQITLIACGPHVHEAALTAARGAHCDVVVTRGQFERDAESILREVFR